MSAVHGRRCHYNLAVAVRTMHEDGADQVLPPVHVVPRLSEDQRRNGGVVKNASGKGVSRVLKTHILAVLDVHDASVSTGGDKPLHRMKDRHNRP